jgi:DNA-binding MarR family transcriptional regulator
MQLATSRDEVRAVLDAIRRIVRLLRESTREAERSFGASSAQLFVLQALAAGTPLSVNDLAARTRTHQSSVSAVVSKLVDRRLVKKRRARSDGRRVELELTKEGHALVFRSPETAQSRIIESVRALSEKRRGELHRGLEALIDALGLQDNAPAMFFEESPRRNRTS